MAVRKNSICIDIEKAGDESRFFQRFNVYNVIFSGETLNLIFTDSSANKMSGIPHYSWFIIHIPGLLFTLALRFSTLKKFTFTYKSPIARLRQLKKPKPQRLKP